MNSVISKNETILSYIIAIALILLMVAASVILDDPEVILPEIAAMAIGIWVYREPGWIRQPSKIFVALRRHFFLSHQARRSRLQTEWRSGEESEDTVSVYARVLDFDFRLDRFMLDGWLPTVSSYSAHTRRCI
ncbi:hypothetical protein FB479_108148 [Brevibacillus sp. AG162]|nr:hypothetical protein FB479_108148 [Brevibacillus sp. AG162]